MKDKTIIIITLGVAAVGYWLYKSGFFDSLAMRNAAAAETYAQTGKYSEYSNIMQGLANNATSNTLAIHGGISEGINNQVNTSVNTALNSITNWANLAQNRRNENDNREYGQFMSILGTI